MRTDGAAHRRQRATIRRFGSAAEADRCDLEYWQQIPQAERILEVWRLSQEQWQLVNSPGDEPRLSRLSTSIHRR